MHEWVADHRVDIAIAAVGVFLLGWLCVVTAKTAGPSTLVLVGVVLALVVYHTYTLTLYFDEKNNASERPTKTIVGMTRLVKKVTQLEEENERLYEELEQERQVNAAMSETLSPDDFV